jgi:hypothetical protein
MKKITKNKTNSVEIVINVVNRDKQSSWTKLASKIEMPIWSCERTKNDKIK